MTDDLRTCLHEIADPVQAPPGMARTALRSAAARRRRHQAVAGSVLVAGGVLVGARWDSWPSAGTDAVTVGAGPTASAGATDADPVPTDIIDGVAVGGLPKGWEPVAGTAPVSRPYEGGTRTRHDLYVPNPAYADGRQILIVEVFRDTRGQVALGTAVGTVAVEQHLRPGEIGTPVRAPGSTHQQGIVKDSGEHPGVGAALDRAVGYKQLDGDTLFLIVRAPERLLPSILDDSSRSPEAE